MPWETRRQRGPYYTRSRRINGKIVREYLGRDKHAQLVAELEQHLLDQRQAQREAAQAHRADLDTLDAQLDAFCTQTDALLHAALTQAGYHQQHRGPWRRRRQPKP